MVAEQAVGSARILLIDDDPEFIEYTRNLLEDVGTVRVAMDVERALSSNVLWQPNLIIVNVLLGHNGDSFNLLDEIRSARGNAPYGIICLARGPGAMTHYHRLGNELFGIMDREVEHDDLREEITYALRMTSRPQFGSPAA